MIEFVLHDLINSSELGISHSVLIEPEEGVHVGRVITIGLIFFSVNLVYFYNQPDE